MTATLATPRRVAFELCASGLSLVVVQGALLVAFVARGAPVGFAAYGAPVGAGVPPGLLALVASSVLVPLVALVAVTVQTVSRTAPLYRAAVLRAADPDAPPPSPTALRDALGAPHRMLGVLGVSWVGVVFLLAGLLVAFGAGAAVLAVALFALGVVAGGAAPFALGVRRALGPWLEAFPPTELARIDGVTYEALASAHGAAVAASVGLVATAFVAGSAAGAWLPTTVGLVSTLAASLAARHLSSRTAAALSRDVADLRQRVSAAAEAQGMPPVSDGDSSPAAAMAQPLVRQIEEALDRVIGGLRASADAEREVKTTIEESQAKKTIFMASMSHDLRGPLNSIMGFSELLTSGISGPLAAAQLLNVAVIQRSGSELLELLNDIIDTARLDAGRLPLRREWMPTVVLLSEATRKGRELVALRTGTGDGFTIEEELEPGLPPVYIDPSRVVQALLCLFRHATRAMEGGAIRLSARSAGDAVRVAVTDSGPSVQGEDRQRVFDAFRSLTSVSGHRIGGMGLALSLARSLVRAHGGDVHYDASAGAGTTIVLLIPTGGPSPQSVE